MHRGETAHFAASESEQDCERGYGATARPAQLNGVQGGRFTKRVLVHVWDSGASTPHEAPETTHTGRPSWGGMGAALVRLLATLQVRAGSTLLRD
jgi:hypothetical protein